MDKKQFILFMSGFPRAGSTLLMNILAQNPHFVGSPTSGLIGSVITIRDNWKKSDIYRANDEKELYPRIRNMMKYMMLGFYYDDIQAGKLPIEKNRIWHGNIDLLDELFGCKVKIIFPMRNVIDSCISMECVNRKSTLNFHGDNGDMLKELTTRGRAQNFLKDDGIFGLPIMHLRELMYRDETDRLAVVPYEELLLKPTEMLKKLHDDLGLPHFNYDFNNIKQTIGEIDIAHGFAPDSLHKIKEGKLLPPRKRDFSIFSEKDIVDMEGAYSDVHDFMAKNSLS